VFRKAGAYFFNIDEVKGLKIRISLMTSFVRKPID
jgi:hypothetical protein